MSKLPLVQQTAPERIWLAVADDAYYADKPFPDAEEICWSSDAPLEVCVPYVRADLATPPEASGADYVLVPREPAEAMTDAGDLARVAHFGTAAEIYAAMLAAAPINPAPPTSGVDWRGHYIEVTAMRYMDNGLHRAAAMQAAEREARSMEAMTGTMQTAEPRAAAKECAPSIAQIGAEAWHLAADLDDLAANGIATAGRAADFIRARLTSGAAEDADDELPVLPDGYKPKESECSIFAAAYFYRQGYAARRARGES